MNKKYKPIGFLDSGVGGISVLKQAIKLLPCEDYIYFGDSKNAPYGTKSVDEVKKLTFNVVNFLLAKEVKAIVVACNTATSAAIRELRYKIKNIPIIGIEPALKPAVELNRSGKILIMATPMTLKEKKFNNLVKKYNFEEKIAPLPCPGLVELIENGVFKGDIVSKYLKDKLEPYLENEISAVVLGCTHYPFIKSELLNIINDVPIIDGSVGTVKELRRKLILLELLNDKKEKGNVEILNSAKDYKIVDLSHKLLNI